MLFKLKHQHKCVMWLRKVKWKIISWAKVLSCQSFYYHSFLPTISISQILLL